MFLECGLHLNLLPDFLSSFFIFSFSVGVFNLTLNFPPHSISYLSSNFSPCSPSSSYLNYMEEQHLSPHLLLTFSYLTQPKHLKGIPSLFYLFIYFFTHNTCSTRHICSVAIFRIISLKLQFLNLTFRDVNLYFIYVKLN